MRVERFEDLEGWQEARKLTAETYRISKQGQLAKDFALCDQMRRAATSIMGNIAEGSGRRTSRAEFIRFLTFAHASVLELESHAYVALDLGYVPRDDFDRLYSQAQAVSRLIGGLIRYLSSAHPK